MDTLWIIAPCIQEYDPSVATKSQRLRKPREELHQIKIPRLPDPLLYLLPHQALPRDSNPPTSSSEGISPYKAPFPLSVKPPVFQVVSRIASTSYVLPPNITMKNNTYPGPGTS